MGVQQPVREEITGGRAIQLWERVRSVAESSFSRIGAEDSDLFEVMGSTALNTRSCFTAAA